MKLVTFKVTTPVGPVQRIGALLGDQKIVDLNSGYAAYLREAGEETRIYEAAALRIPPDMIEYFKGGELSKKAAKQTMDYVQQILKKSKTVTGPKAEKVIYQLSEVKLMSPVPRPNSIREFSIYEEHGSKSGYPRLENWYKYQYTMYNGNCMSVIGPDEPIVRPYYTNRLDCEIEMGFFIGKEGRDIPVEKGDEYIAGFTIFNDCSARDAIGLGFEKHKDFSNVIGPCIVTPDEIDYTNLKATVRVNGEVWFEGNTGRRRQWLARDMVAWASDNETLYPGDFMGEGTIGLGCSLDMGKWYEAGMVVEMEIEGIGILRNPIIQGEQKVDYALNGMKGLLKYTPPKAK